MKKLIFGFLLSLFALSVHAVILTAHLDQFVSRTATIQGVGSGGGYGRFSVLGITGNTGDPKLDLLFAPGEDFLAFCLEPDEFISPNVTYEFEIVDLSLAPTSPDSGPMGIQGQRWVERIVYETGYGSVEELVAGATDSEEHAFQAALYEAGYEDPLTSSFDFDTGDAIVTSPNALLADLTISETQANTILPAGALNGINSYGLLNVSVPGPNPRTIYEAQDFMVFTVPEPEPDLAMMLGFGLLGLGLVVSSRRGRRQ